ncbi:hypothetical protein SCP_0400890 [Sparassis crispa]|uniref:White collar 2 protein n=1 Tax=Sparassis crispa TaxID=139825 RepID=A0A401GHT5_9APHY|nr:hypothetical protein SCP_0400890 [Sparassis crispa]GBE81718.1 hypothetical protein SCP_0400890 [Sparassis crispa]
MSLAQAIPQAGPSNSAPKQKEPQTFEFTKRKRWADLLITELSDAIILVLNATGKVWYCGAAVTELLGWRDEELVDGDLVNLMNVDDRASFRTMFADCLHTRRPLLAYARLQCKNEFCVAHDYSSRPREVLFEITGQPHVSPQTDKFQCFFATAKPYPSRNTAMLNTFLELKVENERLQQRLLQLRAQQQVLDPQASPAASTSSAPPPNALPQDSYYGIPSGGSYDEVLPSPMASRVSFNTRGSFDTSGYAAPSSASGSGSVDDETTEAQRKKVKRMHAAEQYVCVTCGRTDSPEWRKGPLGPKTLCNACGLRWAKKARKEPDAEGDASGPSLLF